MLATKYVLLWKLFSRQDSVILRFKILSKLRGSCRLQRPFWSLFSVRQLSFMQVLSVKFVNPMDPTSTGKFCCISFLDQVLPRSIWIFQLFPVLGICRVLLSRYHQLNDNALLLRWRINSGVWSSGGCHYTSGRNIPEHLLHPTLLVNPLLIPHTISGRFKS